MHVIKRMVPSVNFLAIWGCAVTLIGLVTSLPTDARAQYMFLDVDRDGINTSRDRLNATGTTQLQVWCQTNQNRDGQAARCGSSETGLTISSYEFILRADGGTVQWLGFTNHMQEFTTNVGVAFTSSQYHNGASSITQLSAGTYLLATVEVSVLSGTPSIAVVPTTTLSGSFHTSFGSGCPGRDGDNTLKLGSDWTDTDGAGAPGSGIVPPTGPLIATATGGALYFGGRQMTPPYVLEYVGEDLVVNGSKLRALVPPSREHVQPTTEIHLRHQLSLRCGEVIRRGYKQGLSDRAIIDSLRLLLSASEVVESVRADSTELWITYRGKSESPEGMTLPRRDSIFLLDADERDRRLLEGKRLALLDLQRTLDGGALLVVLPSVRVTIPPLRAKEVGDVIAKYQEGTSLDAGETKLLTDAVMPKYWRYFREPVALDPAR